MKALGVYCMFLAALAVVMIIHGCSLIERGAALQAKPVSLRFEVSRFDASPLYLVTDHQTGHCYLATTGAITPILP